MIKDIRLLTDMGMGDGTPVDAVWLPGGDGEWVVGRNNVKAITLYNENGEMSLVPYLCIELENGKEIRANAKHYDVQIPGEKSEP